LALLIAGVVEALAVGICCTLLYRSASRVIVLLLGAAYLAYFGFATMTWG
jgi:hypothetical protein